MSWSQVLIEPYPAVERRKVARRKIQIVLGNSWRPSVRPGREWETSWK